MSGFMFVLGPCVSCKKIFAFNADLVPSIRINGIREPVCQDCVAMVNPKRAANGVPLIEILPGAYEAQEVG